MKIDFEKCTVTESEIRLTAMFTTTFNELRQEDVREKSGYRFDEIKLAARTQIAAKIAEEFLSKHKMDLVNGLSKEDIVSAIQLKIVEGFSLNPR